MSTFFFGGVADEEGGTLGLDQQQKVARLMMPVCALDLLLIEGLNIPRKLQGP